jgi:hypothetical protein
MTLKLGVEIAIVLLKFACGELGTKTQPRSLSQVLTRRDWLGSEAVF